MADQPSKRRKILPEPGKRNILITSALPYVNNVPHLGNVVGSVLSADVFSRYAKARGYNALFVCGTDEYGTATETKALEEGVTPQELCNKYYRLHKETYDWFNIGFDIFGRTPTQQQTDIAQDIFLNLHKNGYLEEKTTIQPFCVHPNHNSFLADRLYDTSCGECPLCGYADARGDQCDKCGKLLDPLDLINPKCKVDGQAPEQRETTHIFLLLDKLQSAVDEWQKVSTVKGAWSSNGISITQNWLKEGLKPRGITRDLKWGTPIPLPGFEGKVMYVWFDACIGYVSITANYTDEWEKWWRDPENVQLFQFMGKDNTPFHSVVFPASQLGTKQKWTMVHHLATTEYLNYEGGKFSKSRQIGVFGKDAQATGVPSDVWRYYLLSRRPETGDTEFEWKPFIDSNNNELLKNFGNYVNRVIKFMNAKYGSVIPDYTKFSDPYFDTWKTSVNELLKQYINELESVKLMAGSKTAQQIAYEGNKMLQQNTLDNKLLAEQPEKCAAVVGLALNLVHLLASVFEPYMPATSESILRQLNAPFLVIPDNWQASSLAPGHKIGKAEYLFQQIKPEREQEWRELFGGEEARKAKEEKAAKAAARKAKKMEKKEKAAAADEGATSVENVEKGGAQKLSHMADEAVDDVTSGLHQASLQPS